MRFVGLEVDKYGSDLTVSHLTIAVGRVVASAARKSSAYNSGGTGVVLSRSITSCTAILLRTCSNRGPQIGLHMQREPSNLKQGRLAEERKPTTIDTAYC